MLHIQKNSKIYPYIVKVTQRYFTLSTHQQYAGRKRFYEIVNVIQSSNGMYGITLDGRTLKTPARNPLEFSNILLAHAVANEWDAQYDTIKGIQPSTMPMMSLAATAIDTLSTDPTPARNTCISFLPTDTMLFWTLEDSELYEKQKASFQPILDWYQTEFNIHLLTAEAMTLRLNHPEDSINKIQSFVHNLDPYSLACLQMATMECKSILLAIAFLLGRIQLNEAKLYSRMEEEYQAELWGVVEGGHDMDRLNNNANLSSVLTFWNLYHHMQPYRIQKWKSYFTIES